MQQQYSVRNLISTVLSKKLIIFKVMRKQNAAVWLDMKSRLCHHNTNVIQGNPSSTPTRRGGRRRRGVPRGTKWAAVNHPRIDSSEDGVDSDLQLDLELDDDDDEEYEGILPEESDVPEEDEPMVEEEVLSPATTITKLLTYRANHIGTESNRRGACRGSLRSIKTPKYIERTIETSI